MSLTVVAEPRASHASRVKESWALNGHDDEVLSAAAHKNLFSTCSADGVVLTWRMPTAHGKGPENVCKVSTGGRAVLDVCFVDDKRLAAAQGDATVSIWDLETGKRTASLSRVKVPGRTSWPVINAVTMLAKDTLCFGGDDGYVAFADVRSPGVTSSLNRRAPVTALRAVEDGSALLVGDACGHVSGFEQRSAWRKFMDTKCAADAVASVACGAKGDQAAVYTMDGKVSLVDIQLFAVSQQERLLSSFDLHYGTDRTLRRGDWCDELDAVMFPSADGSVARIPASRFSAGVVQTYHSVDGTEDEEEDSAQLYFATVVQEKYAVFGGGASVSLREL